MDRASSINHKLNNGSIQSELCINIGGWWYPSGRNCGWRVNLNQDDSGSKTVWNGMCLALRHCLKSIKMAIRPQYKTGLGMPGRYFANILFVFWKN